PSPSRGPLPRVPPEPCSVCWLPSPRSINVAPAPTTRVSAEHSTLSIEGFRISSGGGISRPLRLRRRARSHVDEAGDRLETAVLRHDAEIRADKARWRIVRPAGFPCEADAVVVCVHGAGETEAIGGKPLLDSLHHHVDTVVTVAAAMWIDVISRVGPSVGN